MNLNNIDMRPDYLKDSNKNVRRTQQEIDAYNEGYAKYLATDPNKVRNLEQWRKIYYYDSGHVAFIDALIRLRNKLHNEFPKRIYCTSCRSIVDLINVDDEDIYIKHNHNCYKCWKSETVSRTCNKIGIPNEHRSFAIDWDWEAQRTDIRNAFNSGRHVFINGEHQTGKTLICCAYLYHKRAKNVMYTNESGILDSIADKEQKDFYKFRQAEILLIDGVGLFEIFNRRLSYALTKLISDRFDTKRQTLITTSLDLQGLSDYIGDQITAKITTSCLNYQLVKPYKETK